MSLVFYAWGEQGYVLLMLLSILFNYVVGRFIEANNEKVNRRRILTVGIIINLLPLFYFKYSEFVVHSFLQIFHRFSIDLTLEATAHHLPIGISFFTFQAMSYIVDVYRGTEKAQKNIINMGLYISFFPQLIAGPIIRYKDIYKYLHTRTISLVSFSEGAERFVFGLAKKVLLANPMGKMADSVFALSADGLSTPIAWIGILCYSLQIYFDFSGYSDMAIGLGRIFGFRYLENFNYPYVSRSMREFWRRWHISLSNWFKDYVYIPLGGNRAGNWRIGLNLFLVFFLCGLWHGASWNFVVWGMLHGFFLVLERGKVGRLLQNSLSIVQYAYVCFVVVLTWTFFRTETLESAFSFLRILFFGGASDNLNTQVIVQMDFNFYLVLFFSVLFATPIYPWVKVKLSKSTCEIPGIFSLGGISSGTFRLGAFSCLFLLSAMNLANGSYNPFIYFRF